jgi:hypothetical protein
MPQQAGLQGPFLTKANFKPLIDATEKLMSNVAIRRGNFLPKSTDPIIAQAVAQQILLALWPDTVCGVPNVVLRGALFSISQRRAIAKNRELIATVDGIEIRFKGERFNQTDLDVWEMLLHFARRQPLGERVEFNAYTFLKSLGRGVGGHDHEQLKEEITRLRSGTLEIKWTKEEKTFGGGLVNEYFYDGEKERYIVILSDKMLSLYDEGYSHIDWQQRKKLKTNNLAKWLHGFYASHAKPFPYKVETIRKRCGSTSARLGDFRKQIRSALNLLKEVGAITNSKINSDDLIVIEKVPTASQHRHLRREKFHAPSNRRGV